MNCITKLFNRSLNSKKFEISVAVYLLIFVWFSWLKKNYNSWGLVYVSVWIEWKFKLKCSQSCEPFGKFNKKTKVNSFWRLKRGEVQFCIPLPPHFANKLLTVVFYFWKQSIHNVIPLLPNLFISFGLISIEHWCWYS